MKRAREEGRNGSPADAGDFYSGAGKFVFSGVSPPRAKRKLSSPAAAGDPVKRSMSRVRSVTHEGLGRGGNGDRIRRDGDEVHVGLRKSGGDAGLRLCHMAVGQSDLARHACPVSLEEIDPDQRCCLLHGRRQSLDVRQGALHRELSGTRDVRGRIWANGSRRSGGLGASASDGAAGVSVPGGELRPRTWPIFTWTGPERWSRLGPTQGRPRGLPMPGFRSRARGVCQTGLGRFFWNMLQTAECE